MSEASGRRGGWARFRRWPRWAQGLLWLLLWPVALVLLALSKPPGARRAWWAAAAAGVALWIGIGVGLQASTRAVTSTSPTTFQATTPTTTARRPRAPT